MATPGSLSFLTEMGWALPAKKARCCREQGLLCCRLLHMPFQALMPLSELGSGSCAHSQLPLQTVADVRLWGGRPARAAYSAATKWQVPAFYTRPAICCDHFFCHSLSSLVWMPTTSSRSLMAFLPHLSLPTAPRGRQ